MTARKPVKRKINELTVKTIPVETFVERAYCTIDGCGEELLSYHKFNDGVDIVVSHRCANQHVVIIERVSFPKITYRDLQPEEYFKERKKR